CVARVDEPPVTPASVSTTPGEPAHRVTQKFAAPADYPDQERTRTERTEPGTDDAARSLVSHIREKAYNTDCNDETPCATLQCHHVSRLHIRFGCRFCNFTKPNV